METKKLRNGGFTLLETLLTVAILVILLGVSAVGAVYYRDYLEITELDNAARDIYMAAENRAVLLQNSGASVALLSAEGGGSGGTVTLSSAGDEAKLADLLPTGTIDPALWKGDFRIIYDQATGHVKEVFYAEAEKETIPNDLEHLEQFRGTRAARVALFRSGGTLVGYYGSEVGEAIGTKPLPTPGVEVFIENGEELTLTVRYTLPEGLPAGVTATPSIKLYYPTGSTTPIKSLEPVLTFSGNTATYEMVLDSLESGKQFKDLKSGLFSGLTDLGGDFTVNAGLTLAVPTDPEWIDSAYYATGSDNSLFAKGSTYNTAGGTAKIANLRHLQNLCANFSEVGDGITKAEQTADIDCRGAEEPPDTRYEFIPIENTNLTSYIGKYSGKDGDVNTHINNLYVKQGVAAAGLFGKVTSGLEITDCRVCWTRPKALVGGTDYVYAVSGTNAGGLIGAVTGGTVKIENSFAATTVQGDGKSGKSGGLVGTQTGGTLTIKNSYADCYLSGTNAGGLVGSKTGGTLKIDRSYAAGFIVDGTTTAGLVNGSVDTATHCYSVVRVIQKDTDGKETLVEPATRMYTDWDKDPGSAFYLSSPADVTEDQLGNAFEYTNADNSPETHVYNLRHKLDNTVETLTPPYPFPGLKDTDGTAMPHYGDWAKQDSIPAGLVYYEFYKDRTTDVWGVFEDLEDLEDKKIGIGVCGVLENGDALEDLENDNITKDGYALVFEGKNAPGKYVIQYGNDEHQAPWTLEGSPISVDVGGKTYTLLPLPDGIVTGELPGTATAKFYQQLTCGTGADMRTYWFNPHFAKTVETTKPADLNLPVTSIIFVRTPRHFYDLSNYQNNYVNSKGYSFLQELDLDYGSYKGYPGIFEPKEGELPFKQLPIGQGSSTNVSFRGTYDGGCHKIKNVFFISTNNEYRYLGLFGWVNKSNGISLKNIVYELDPNRVETVTYYEAAQSFGTLVGTLQQGTMTNCAVYGVNMSITGHALDCGGLVGTNNGTITGCSSELVSLTVDKSWAGGLVGSSGGIVENSYAVGKIVVTGAGASGLVNETKDGTVTNCYAAVSLTATDQIRGLSNISSNVENSGFLVGTFKYRGEEYTVDNTYQADDGKGAGKRITPAKLAETVTLDPVNNNTVKNIPAGATYAKDYGGEFPYLTGVTDGNSKPIHYGLWPSSTPTLPNPGVKAFIVNGEELTLTVEYTVPAEGVPNTVVCVPDVTLDYQGNEAQLLYANEGAVESPFDARLPKSIDIAEAKAGDTVVYTWVLDSLLDDKQFKGLFKDSSDIAFGGDFTATVGLKLTAPGYIESEHISDSDTDNSLFAKDSGNTSTAYIDNLRHLQNLDSDFSNAAKKTAAVQRKDIDASKVKSNDKIEGTDENVVLDPVYKFKPIANWDLHSYDAAGPNDTPYYIENLKIDVTGDAGLFSGVNYNFNFKNIHLIKPVVEGGNAGTITGSAPSVYFEKCWVSSANVKGTGYTGGLASYWWSEDEESGKNYGPIIIENCKVTDLILEGVDFSGGLAGGGPEAKVSGCTVENADITVTGWADAGGLFGYESGEAEFKDCKVLGSTIKSSNSTAGGLVGSAGEKDSITCAEFIACNVKDVTVAASLHAGGLVGYSDADKFTSCEAVNASVSSTAWNSDAGGLIGEARDTTLDKCKVYWEPGKLSSLVYQVKSVTAGGLVGTMRNGGTITNSFAATFVEGRMYVGGLVGNLPAEAVQREFAIKRSYADCYLYVNETGVDWSSASGLVGLKEPNGTVKNEDGTITNTFRAKLTLEDVYAAGFITVEKGTASGLSGGWDSDEITIKNAYAAVHYEKANSTIYPLAGGIFPTTSNNDPNGLYFLESAEANMWLATGYDQMQNIPLGAAFEKKAGDSSKRYGLSTSAGSGPYPFPGLKGLPHYGDWLKKS